jgi:multiple sugar transport system substrate-binding protein
MRLARIGLALLLALPGVGICFGEATADESFLDVGKQAPITILINASPWYSGFEHVVDLYTRQTGNQVKLEVTPFPGMLQKARDAVRTPGTSPLDLININSLFVTEFYAGGYLEPPQQIDPGFTVPKEVYSFDDANCWDAAKQFRTCKTGKLMGYAPNGNVELLFYRRDVFEQRGLKPPVTFDDVLKNCEAVHNPPSAYGYVVRGERGEINYDWGAFMLAYGAKVEADPENGDYRVTLNSPQAKQALDKFLEIDRKCGPANYGTLGQGELIQLVQTGKAIQSQAVIAAFPNFDDPTKSAVVDKVDAEELPRATPDGKPGVELGTWVFAIPKNASDPGKKGAVAFSKWFLTYKAQYAYAQGGGIPVREDVFDSDLKDQPKYRWMKAYKAEVPYGQQLFGYPEGAAVIAAIGLKLNQALNGQLSSAAALNQAAQNVRDIFAKNGRKTGMLPPLPEK